MSHEKFLAPQNQYRPVNMAIPRIRYAKINLNSNPSGQVTLQPTSSTLMEWKIAASTAYNISRAFVASQYTIAAGGAGTYAVANCQSIFKSIYYGNGSGLAIVDLQNSDCYGAIMRPLKTRFTDFLSRDQLSRFYPCNQLNTTNLLPFSRDGLATGTQNASSMSYIEPQYLEISPTPNTALNVFVYEPLGDIKDTYFELDKDTVHGQDMYIRAQSNFLQRLCYYTTTPSNPSANVTSPSSSITMTNCYLYLPIEENLDIRNSLLTSLASGKIKMKIPYTYAYRISASAAGATANTSITLTKNYGASVEKITVAAFAAQENSGNLSFDHSNVNGTKISQIQSTMDGRPLQDYLLNCYNPNSSINPTGVGWTSTSNFGDDYRENIKFLKGSCINGYSMYQTNWFHCDSWSSFDLNPKIPNHFPDENVICGFDLLHSGDHIYALQAPTPSTATIQYTQGMILYVFVTFQKTLEVMPDGIILGP